MAREYFCAYHSYLEWMETLSDAEKGRLFVACLQYSETGEAPDLRGNERVIFPAFRRQIDRDKEEYERKCERLRQNGSKGGQANGKQLQANAPQMGSKCTPREKGKGKREISANADNPPISPLEGAVAEFIAHRKKLGKPMTDRAVQLFRAELEKLAPSDEQKQIELINHAMLNGWLSVYPMDKPKRGTGSNAKYEQRDYNPADLDGVLLKF